MDKFFTKYTTEAGLRRREILAVQAIRNQLSWKTIEQVLGILEEHRTAYSQQYNFEESLLRLSYSGNFSLKCCSVRCFWWKGRGVQVVGIMPCLLTAWGVAHGHRVLAFWRFLDGSQSTITACKHGLSARAPNFTAFHGFSRLFRILSDPGMEGGVLDPAQTYQIFWQFWISIWLKLKLNLRYILSPLSFLCQASHR